jgi:hypothetical protein
MLNIIRRRILILNLKLPQEIVDAFKEEFGKDIEDYWNPFQGWLWGNCDIKLLDDFPALACEQHDIISDIINHEAKIYEEYVRWANLELTRREHNPFKKDIQHYPSEMLDDVIQ